MSPRRPDGTPTDALLATPDTEHRDGWAMRLSVLIGLAFLVGAPSAYLAFSEANYIAEGSLWIAPEVRPDGAQATTASSLPNPWIELLRSYAVLDNVVIEQGLWTGAGTTDDPDVESVRKASTELSRRLMTAMRSDGHFLRLQLSGPDAETTQRTLDALMRRHVDLASQLKRRKLDEAVAIYEEQHVLAMDELRSAERALEEFRVGTIRDAADEAPTGGTASRQASPSAEEERLTRRISGTELLYGTVREQLEAARLAAASMTPDVRILDPAAITGRTRLRR